MCRSIYKTNSFNLQKPLPKWYSNFPPINSQGVLKINKTSPIFDHDNFRKCVYVSGMMLGQGLKFKGENLKLPIFIGYSAVPKKNF